MSDTGPLGVQADVVYERQRNQLYYNDVMVDRGSSVSIMNQVLCWLLGAELLYAASACMIDMECRI